MTAEKFEDLNLVKPLLRVLKAENYIEPTPIQTQAIPIVLNGNDILGIAQTGTGKTAAFGLPIVQYRVGVIQAAACGLVTAGNVFFFLTIWGFLRTFNGEEDFDW